MPRYITKSNQLKAKQLLHLYTNMSSSTLYGRVLFEVNK